MLKLLKEQAAFTLIELLLTLSISCMILLITPRLQPFLFPMYDQNGMNVFEWNVFLKQAEIEFREARSLEKESTQLQLRSQTNELITYRMNGMRLIRQINNSGYEILLQNIRSATFESHGNRLAITVVDVKNKIYTRVITRFHGVERE
ncbi:competence type IV pilus minor pilin ComGF [Bacillus sp. 165]|uniref:competence type IV pilus minor pilin ComGF n=1 Tax=Bacillus sp. 165 TaxID=1529117 RepID=UPI001ADBE92F|nr:competence type IV pilus minor pilin ComGF [Bacillus sp. 165]MBO9129669.1 prepilin-type N-terminal cleavage/methylation domain-containing protein [Bacillus sp. 165]